MTKSTLSAIGLGSNVGSRKEYLFRAIELLNDHPQIMINKISSIYETEPVGMKNQPWFLNMVVKLETTLDVYELFNYLNKIENTMGRTRNIRWGPRTIDLDLLLYGDMIVDTPELIIPHPRIEERLFVLIPLMEVLEDVELSSYWKKIKTSISEKCDGDKVILFEG
ncbi:2-amino-4-hydroxy-6-hydroxymethyldihydropteridine diphosphokinase [Paenibacillus solani]|uniref:2-amino-4-hydroxy-6- hydroxymethyldihydropteridine diphosphokinase n=1 Tax=Paenibacillus solani TaxID=1705565 RepID=UPI003D297305